MDVSPGKETTLSATRRHTTLLPADRVDNASGDIETSDAQELFATPVHHRRGYQRIERSGTGLVTITVRHSALTKGEALAIGEFRLRQYVLAGLYERETMQRFGLTTDPAMSLLAPQDVHIAVGDTSGRFLCYLSMQSPLPALRKHGREPRNRDRRTTPRLGDTSRLLFPCETEYGIDIFGTHPLLRRLPLTRVRELTRLVRAQDAHTRRTSLAVIEAVVAMVNVLLSPREKIAAILGCSVTEARRLLYGLGMPMAYAPLAPILGDNEGGALPGQGLLWSGTSHIPGRFWPFALLTSDLAEARDHITALSAALDLNEGEAMREVGRIRRRGLRNASRLTVSPELSGNTLWTADPFFAEAQQQHEAKTL